mgnify:CR=1 FL=1
MSGETSQKLADLSNEREVIDKQRFKKNMHRVNTRLDPTVSTRGVKIENSEQTNENLDNSFQMSSTNENNEGMNALSEAATNITKNVVEEVVDKVNESQNLDIDKEATSKAIIEALRAVGTDFVATKEERDELKKLVCGKGTTNADRRMKIALVFVCALALVAYVMKKNNAEKNSKTYDSPITVAAVN